MPAEPLPSTGASAPPPAGAPGATTPEWRCDTADLIMFHRFLRMMFHEAPALVERVDEGDRRQAGRVAGHIAQIATALHQHHHGEDVYVWDDLATRTPACALHVSQMRTQHAEITELLERLRTALAPWSTSASRADAAVLLVAITRLTTTLDRHLGQEEREILPVAAVSFTQAEWDRLAEHGRATAPKDWALVQLGFMLESMPDAERAEFLRALPAFVRVLWSVVGRAQYRRYRARLYGPEAASRV